VQKKERKAGIHDMRVQMNIGQLSFIIYYNTSYSGTLYIELGTIY
jgi:hypothetical protein